MSRAEKIMFGVVILIIVLVTLMGLSQATITDTNFRHDYTCDAVDTTFDYTFGVLEDDDVEVYLVDAAGAETQLTLNTDYTVAGNGTPEHNSDGGTVTTTAACASGYTLTIIRNVEYTQELDLVAGSRFPVDSVEKALDKNTMHNIQLANALDRSLKVTKTSTVRQGDLEIVPSAGKVIGWNAAADGLTNYALSDYDAAYDPRVYLSTEGTVSNAVATIGSAYKTLVVDTTLAVNEDVTIPANVHLHFLGSGQLNVGSGYTLTVNNKITGPASAGTAADHLFGGEGTLSGTGLLAYGARDWIYTGDGLTASSLFTVFSTPMYAGYPPLRLFESLVVRQSVANPTTQLKISVDEHQMQNSDDSNHRWNNNTAATDTIYNSLSGASGLDTGALTASTKYYVYGIWDAVNNVYNGILSTSASGPTMPSGYTYYGLIGEVFVNSAGEFTWANQWTGSYMTGGYEGTNVDYDVTYGQSGFLFDVIELGPVNIGDSGVVTYEMSCENDGNAGQVVAQITTKSGALFAQIAGGAGYTNTVQYVPANYNTTMNGSYPIRFLQNGNSEIQLKGYMGGGAGCTSSATNTNFGFRWVKKRLP